MSDVKNEIYSQDQAPPTFFFFFFFLLWKSAIRDVTKVADATPKRVFAHGSLWSGGSKVYVN